LARDAKATANVFFFFVALGASEETSAGVFTGGSESWLRFASKAVKTRVDERLRRLLDLIHAGETHVVRGDEPHDVPRPRDEPGIAAVFFHALSVANLLEQRVYELRGRALPRVLLVHAHERARLEVQVQVLEPPRLGLLFLELAQLRRERVGGIRARSAGVGGRRRVTGVARLAVAGVRRRRELGLVYLVERARDVPARRALLALLARHHHASRAVRDGRRRRRRFVPSPAFAPPAAAAASAALAFLPVSHLRRRESDRASVPGARKRTTRATRERDAKCRAAVAAASVSWSGAVFRRERRRMKS
jgi:hypothetical protein